MAKAYDFGKNQILRGEFLNSLQDVLQTYLDNFLLTRSGNQVMLPATASEPVAITVAGRMRQIPLTLVSTPTGAAGSRSVFVSIRTVGFTLDTPTSGVPTGGDLVAFKEVGSCTWDGVTVTGVETFAVRTNADFLGGRSSSFEPAQYAVAVAGVDGRLHPDWFPEVAERQEAIGAVRRLWAVSNAAFTTPTDWVIMDGRTLGPTEHSFPGGGTITIPDMRNRVPLGANRLTAYGTPGIALNTSGAAPGISGPGGSNTPRSFSHSHSVAGHQHDGAAHTHLFNHSHPVPAHAHSINNENHGHVDSPDPVFEDRVFSPSELAGGGPTSQGTINTSNGGNVTTSAAGGGTTDPGLTGSLDVRPAHVGLVYLLKVH